jgi:hypothetical protein
LEFGSNNGGTPEKKAKNNAETQRAQRFAEKRGRSRFLGHTPPSE